jgi:chromosome segregation ATPase
VQPGQVRPGKKIRRIDTMDKRDSLVFWKGNIDRCKRDIEMLEKQLAETKARKKSAEDKVKNLESELAVKP